jgi:hypothetical protein
MIAGATPTGCPRHQSGELWHAHPVRDLTGEDVRATQHSSYPD